jgi:hypothetical protein
VSNGDRAIRIAMWSGPRNISTAMMRSWGSRPDTAVCDEPLYACYLKATGIDHPGRDEVIAHHESDWRKVTAWLTGPIPGGRPVWYQKHMSHHLLPEIGRDWLTSLINCFLIREPGEMIVSLAKVTPNPRLEDTGLPQQLELFEAERARTGRIPPVIDARDVLTDPRGTLAALCGAVGLPFDEAMLRWPPGPRPTDGVWARHWYSAVEKSTGFEPYRPRDEKPPEHLRLILARCEEIYRALHPHRLRAAVS